LIPVKYFGKRIFGETRRTIRSGNWHGNDTLWRMVLDLNKVLFYANPDGTLRADDAANRKRYLSIVDGIIAGEGNGPEAPDPRECGVLIVGTNPVAVDATCARIMGFDWKRIPSIANAFRISRYKLADVAYDDIEVLFEDPVFHGGVGRLSTASPKGFKPHFGWTGHVELQETP